jgi:hypothetical protein
MNEQRAAANDRRLGLERSIPVAFRARGMGTAALVIAVDRRAVGGIDRRLEGAELGEQLLFASAILRKREAVIERRRADVVEVDAMPGLEIGKPPARVVGAANDQRDQREQRREAGTSNPAPERGHRQSLHALA